jgi:LysR family transcriptional regulator, nitrogen assimilation regulatory protein
MDSRRLRYFVLIVDNGSITKAAAAAGVAQPALSQQLAILESELRVKLLNRGAGGVTPTPAGRVLYTRAQAILRQVEELRSAVHDEVRPLSGSVLVGISPTMVDRFAIPLIEKVCSQHPEMRLQVVEDGSAQLRELLVGGRIEIAISPSPPDDEIGGEEILTERLMTVSSTSWEPLDNMSLTDLAKLPWVLASSPNSIRRLVDAIFTANNLSPHIVVQIDSLHAGIAAAQRGIGITAMPEGVVLPCIIEGKLNGCYFGDTTPVVRPMYLTYKVSPALSPPAQFAFDLLREIGADLRAEITTRK